MYISLSKLVDSKWIKHVRIYRILVSMLTEILTNVNRVWRNDNKTLVIDSEGEMIAIR
jgi:hypothetical protein